MSKLSEAVTHARRLREIRASLGEGKQARAASASPAKIKQARHLLKLSQDAFASLLGVSRVTVANWEAGTVTPAERYMDKIIELLITAEQTDAPPHLGPAEILRLRKTWGYTQTQFAIIIETTQRTLSSWEQGTARPSTIRTCFLLDNWRALSDMGEIETLEELKKAQLEK